MSVLVLPDRIAGRRVVRALARGPRADLLLVRDDDGSCLVAKLFAPESGRAEIDRELTALARVAHPHVLELVDAETTPDGRVVALLPQLTRGSLARWLEERDRIAAGEAVTVLAPLASALEAGHRAGVAHGRLSSTRVLFDAAGAPVVTGFGSAVLFARDAPEVVRERIPEVLADLEALRSIAETTLSRVTGVGAEAAGELCDRVVATAPFGVGRVLVDGLFAFSAGSPIRFEPAPVRTEAAPPARALPAEARIDLLDRMPGRIVRDRARAAWARIDPGRRRLVVGVLAAGATALVAVLLVPGSERSSAVARDAPDTASPTASAAPRAGRSVTASAGDAAVGDAAVVAGADPLAAFAVLVRTHERCLRDQDERCLDAVDEPGSPAARADAEAIADGKGVALSTTDARVVQEWGGSALVEAGQPPTRVLLVRGADGGWRLRDLPVTAVG